MIAVKKYSMTSDAAQALALQGLTFLAADPERLGRFLSLTGMGPQDLRSHADQARLHLAVLDHILSDESLLLVAANNIGVAPESFAKAGAILAEAEPR